MSKRAASFLIRFRPLIAAFAGALALFCLAETGAARPKAKVLLELPQGLSERHITELREMKLEERLEIHRIGLLEAVFEPANWAEVSRWRADPNISIPDRAQDLLIKDAFSWIQQEREARYFVLGRFRKEAQNVILHWQLVDVNEAWDDLEKWLTHKPDYVIFPQDMTAKERIDQIQRIVSKIAELAPHLALDSAAATTAHKKGKMRLWCFVEGGGYYAAAQLQQRVAAMLKELLPKLPNLLAASLMDSGFHQQKGYIIDPVSEIHCNYDVPGEMRENFENNLEEMRRNWDFIVWGYIDTVGAEGGLGFLPRVVLGMPSYAPPLGEVPIPHRDQPSEDSIVNKLAEHIINRWPEVEKYSQGETR